MNALPLHMQGPFIADLSAPQPGPEAVWNYLEWVLADAGRTESAVQAMQWLAVGFHVLYVNRDYTNAPIPGVKTSSTQLNFYHPDYPPNEHPHAHSRLADAIFIAPDNARQEISRYRPLPLGSASLPGLVLKEVVTVSISGVDNLNDADPRRPDYLLHQLDPRYIVLGSLTRVAPGGSQEFHSHEVHHVGVTGLRPGQVAVSVHQKFHEESPALSNVEGLVAVKGLSVDEAVQLFANRRQQAAELKAQNCVLGPAAMSYPSVVELQERPLPEVIAPVAPGADHAVAYRMLIGGRNTAKAMALAR